MVYQFKKPVDTSTIPTMGNIRLNEIGSFAGELVNLDKSTASTGAESLDFTFKVVTGLHKGREHVESLFIWHDNPKAKEIAVKTMGMVLRALNGGEDGQFNGPELIGKRCMFDRFPDGEYEGRPEYRTRNWRPYRPGDDPDPTPAVQQSATADAGYKTGDPIIDDDDLGGW